GDPAGPGEQVSCGLARRKTCAELRASETAMRDAMFFFRRELGHRAAVAGDDEHRVVAETALAARHLRDLAVHFPFEELDVAVGRGERGHADEARRSVLDSRKHREQAGVPVLRARVLAEEAPAPDTRSAARCAVTSVAMPSSASASTWSKSPRENGLPSAVPWTSMSSPSLVATTFTSASATESSAYARSRRSSPLT